MLFAGSWIASSVKMRSSAVTGTPSLHSASGLSWYVRAKGSVSTFTDSTRTGSYDRYGTHSVCAGKDRASYQARDVERAANQVLVEAGEVLGLSPTTAVVSGEMTDEFADVRGATATVAPG